MYNGIGLPTVRGTGTSGYVQTNRAAVRPQALRGRGRERGRGGAQRRGRARVAPTALVEHEARRRVEVAVAELEDDLAARNYDASSVATMASRLRTDLLARSSEERAAAADHDLDARVKNAVLPADRAALPPDLAKRRDEQLRKALRITSARPPGNGTSLVTPYAPPLLRDSTNATLSDHHRQDSVPSQTNGHRLQGLVAPAPDPVPSSRLSRPSSPSLSLLPSPPSAPVSPQSLRHTLSPSVINLAISPPDPSPPTPKSTPKPVLLQNHPSDTPSQGLKRSPLIAQSARSNSISSPQSVSRQPISSRHSPSLPPPSRSRSTSRSSARSQSHSVSSYSSGSGSHYRFRSRSRSRSLSRHRLHTRRRAISPTSTTSSYSSSSERSPPRYTARERWRDGRTRRRSRSSSASSFSASSSSRSSRSYSSRSSYRSSSRSSSRSHHSWTRHGSRSDLRRRRRSLANHTSSSSDSLSSAPVPKRHRPLPNRKYKSSRSRRTSYSP